MNSVQEALAPLFIIPEKTSSGCSFADIPQKISFLDSDVIFYGVPLDITTSFGKGTLYGPQAIRITSARQIETYIHELNLDIQDSVRVFDMGDLDLPSYLTSKKPVHLASQSKNNTITSYFTYLDQVIPKITRLVYYDAKKVPLMIGGEHTLSYFSIKSLAEEKPVVIQFDAHRDLKDQYEGLKMCHTTPFYHLLNGGYIHGNDLVQIGIRQGDREENRLAADYAVATLDAWSIHDNIESAKDFLRKKTCGRRIYISFDIDVYDIPYVPCTGTPEPFGLNPFQVVDLIKCIDKTSEIIGIDVVEVSLKNHDYREGALAAHTLLRILTSGLIKTGK